MSTGEKTSGIIGGTASCAAHGDIIVVANHEQDTLLIADCVPAHYGHTHPEPAYNYLKDRRPDSYRELLAPKVNFMKGGYIYPH